MSSMKLFWFLLLGVVASTLSASVADDQEPQELGQLEGPNEIPEVEDEDDDDERAFWSTREGEKRCTCDNISCQCCVNPTVPVAGKVSTCLKVTVRANEKAIQLQLLAKNKDLISHKFVIGARDSMCASVPGSLSSIKGCIDTETSNLPNNQGIQTCPSLQLKTVGKTVASLEFACIQLSNRKVSMNDNGRVKAHQKVGIKFF